MTLHDRIAEMSRTVYAWSAARTATAADAEDLTQEVLLAMLRAAPNLKDERAFYGFMWSVARHVYSVWLRRRRVQPEPLESAANAPSGEDPFAVLETTDELCLLRRELTLLGRQCRQAAVLYYVRGMKVAQIAQALSVSQSMVKYLLFKARNTIREGMEMKRNYGEQSYHPRRLDLRYWGKGPNHYYNMAGTLLRQNILFACYNDALAAEQIALAVGVGLPYMEDDLAQLAEVDLLTRDGMGRYRTNIVIFTEDYVREASALIAPECRAIADRVKACIAEKETAIRSLGFKGCDMNAAAFRWQTASLLLHRAVIGMAGASAAPRLPEDKWGVPCVCWAVEPFQGDTDDFAFGASEAGNSTGAWAQFMDFPINGEMVHHMLYQQPWSNVFLSIASGGAAGFSENDEAMAAEMVRKGYVLRGEDGLAVNCPVLTDAQYRALLEIISAAACQIRDIALTIRDKEAGLLAEHVPEHLRDAARDMVYFRLFESAISMPMALLHAERFLPDARTGDVLPTTYVVLS